MNKVLSIKSGKTVGSGKSLLLTFLAMSISTRRENFAFRIDGLEGDDFILLISECPPTLERSGINRKPTFPLFPQAGEEIGQRRKNDGNHLTLTISSRGSGIASTRLLAHFNGGFMSIEKSLSLWFEMILKQMEAETYEDLSPRLSVFCQQCQEFQGGKTRDQGD